MNEFGRYGDTEIAHVAPGEMVLPQDVLRGNPELFEMILQALQQAGMDPARYMVSSGENSINPMTGAQEFYGSDAERGFEDAQGQFGGAQGNEPGYGDGRHSTGGGSGGGGAGINAVDVQAAAKAGKSYGGISAPDLSKTFPDLFETPDPSADARGTQSQRGLNNAGYGDQLSKDRAERESEAQKQFTERLLFNTPSTPPPPPGSPPDKNVPSIGRAAEKNFLEKAIDDIFNQPHGVFSFGNGFYHSEGTSQAERAIAGALNLNPFGVTSKLGINPNTGKKGIGFSGTSGGVLGGALGLATGVPFTSVAGNYFSDVAGEKPTHYGYLDISDDIGTVSSPPGLSDDGGPDPYSPQAQAQINEIMRAFSPPPVAEMPSWLTFPTAMNDRQKRSYLTTNALYGGNSNFRSDETYDLWKSLFQNNAYSDTGELRALSDLLQQTERTYLTNNRGQTVPSTTQQLLNIL